MEYSRIAYRETDIAAKNLAMAQETMASRCDVVTQSLRGSDRFIGSNRLILSHATALQLIGIELPKLSPGHIVNGTFSAEAIHASVPDKSSRQKWPGTQFHYWPHATETVEVLERFLCVPPVVAWEQMSLWVSVTELAVLGDSMMRRDPRLKKASIDQFADQLALDRSFLGRRKCLQALPLMMEDTDSSQETRLRLKMAQSGFENAIVNMKIKDPWDGGIYYLDLAYLKYHFALEYQGWHHGEHQQAVRDSAKRRLLRRHGWEIFDVYGEDLESDAKWNKLIAAIISHVGVGKTFAL
jgi:very-short-patch-repair endonuclease